ncbi:MAG: hypothetical protein QXV28_07020 [Ignisphaera sp.]
MKLTVRVRGKPEAIFSILKKMNSNSNCCVYMYIESEEELLRLVSLSIESGASIEIIPGEPLSQIGSDLAHQSININQENSDVKNSSEISLLNKYKKRAETKTSPVQRVEQSRSESLNLQREVMEESNVGKRSVEQSSPPSAPSTPQLQSSLQSISTSVTQPVKEDRKTSEEKLSKLEVEDVFIKAEEEASSTEEIHFEELVKMKEEAFSRKIIE